ncbi:hypothetical protein C8J57DRAFT_1527416 [Mycena rebaudengoi]|nr:hypothetical protein C8J57DRAFT_1527416 [Mycena rebaudengoi]
MPRHVIVLKAPTDVPAALPNIFDDQIAFDCDLENIECFIDRKSGKNEVRLGAYYDPRVYYDFNGSPYFWLEFVIALQLDISDHNKVLIPP